MRALRSPQLALPSTNDPAAFLAAWAETGRRRAAAEAEVRESERALQAYLSGAKPGDREHAQWTAALRATLARPRRS
jgi:hypothetical protein